MKRVLALAHKEMLHILRDRRSLILAFLLPVLTLLLYGYAVDMEIKRVRVGILDLDRTPQSADFIRRMTAGDFIIDSGRLTSRDEVEPAFRRDLYRAVLVFPEGYAQRLTSERSSPVQVLIDGADGTTAAAVGNYLSAVVARLSREIAEEQLGRIAQPIESRPRVLYNPELVSAHFIVPGLTAVVLIMVCTLLTSVAITREKETGTLEQILTTPVRGGQIVVGKLIPYMGLGAIDATMILLTGHLVFGVPMHGSWLVLAGYGLIYLCIALGLGLLLSAVSRTQQIAMMNEQILTMLPAMMLSGFVFPIASMPWPLQAISRLVPATYFLRIIRGVMLKGQAWFPLEAGVMLLMAVVVLFVSARSFRTGLES